VHSCVLAADHLSVGVSLSAWQELRDQTQKERQLAALMEDEEYCRTHGLKPPPGVTCAPSASPHDVAAPTALEPEPEPVPASKAGLIRHTPRGHSSSRGTLARGFSLVGMVGARQITPSAEPSSPIDLAINALAVAGESRQRTLWPLTISGSSGASADNADGCRGPVASTLPPPASPTPGSSRWLKAQAREAIWRTAQANAEMRRKRLQEEEVGAARNS
jgi:hypothetical protein